MFKQMALGFKVASGFVLVLGLMLATNIISYVDFLMVARDVKTMEIVAQIETGILEARRSEKNYIIRKDRKYIDEVKGNVAEIKKQAQELKDVFDEGDDKKRLDEVIQAAEKYQQNFLNYSDLYEKQVEPDKKAEHDQLLANVEKAMVAAARSVQRGAKDAQDKINKKLTANIFFTKTILILGSLLAIALGSLAAFLITRSVTKPINRALAGLEDGANQVSAASAQVSAASQSFAEGTSEQAAAVEETSSSIEELSSMTRQNAENAQLANATMLDTAKVVEEANQAMKDLTQSMRDISRAAEETAKIIKTIEEIAFQTNLLALNAAVEAARAGVAGVGFAVVADEVRNLAIRAADAAKNTAGLIEGTVKSISGGSEIVSRTNAAFAKVAQGAKKAGELVGEIAAASQEQAHGIEQINKAISEMDKVVQQNASGAEETSSAAEELSGQAVMMKNHAAELAALIRGGAGRVLAVDPVSSELDQEVSRAFKSVGRNQSPVYRTPAYKTKNARPDRMIPMDERKFRNF